MMFISHICITSSCMPVKFNNAALSADICSTEGTVEYYEHI
jgi:hypothetical protein